MECHPIPGSLDTSPGFKRFTVDRHERKIRKSDCNRVELILGFLEIVVSEMLLVPGVEVQDASQDDFELKVGGKAFAHIHKPDRIDIRLPPDIKENVLARGLASRSPEPHDQEGWVVMRLGQNPPLPALTRLLHSSYRFTSTML